MKLRIICFGDNTEHITECQSFEFRTNQVANWIRYIDSNGKKTFIHNVCAIESLTKGATNMENTNYNGMILYEQICEEVLDKLNMPEEVKDFFQIKVLDVAQGIFESRYLEQ